MFTKEMINEKLIRIHLPGNVFAYYLEGDTSGLLIDTGFGYGDLKSFIDSISTKPYILVCTHGHLDHAGGVVQFDTVYMNHKDLDVARMHTDTELRTNYFKSSVSDFKEELVQPMCPLDRYQNLEDGMTFDLGNLHVVSIDLPGHTPGSVVLYIPEYRIVLFGDAINSAGFLQLPESSSIPEYREALIHFNSFYKGKYDIALFSHPHNFGGTELVDETIELCDEIIDGTLIPVEMGDGIKAAKPFNEQNRRIDGKTANFLYK